MYYCFWGYWAIIIEGNGKINSLRQFHCDRVLLWQGPRGETLSQRIGFKVIYATKSNQNMKYSVEKLPSEMLKIVEGLKQMKSRKECLELAYDILTKRYKGKRFRTYIALHQLFINNPKKLWNKKYLICVKTNYLMRIFLVASGFFKDEDIKSEWSLIWYVSPHQYLRVKLDNSEFINVDVWGENNRIKFGDYARGFH